MTSRSFTPRQLSTRPIDIVRDHGDFPLWLQARERFTAKLDELFPQAADGASSPSSPGDTTSDGGGGGGGGGVAPGLHRGLPGLVLDLVSAAAVPRAVRSQGQIHKLYRYLLEQPFFMDFERARVEQISARVGHAYFPAGTPVMHQGALGEIFYLIVSGSVSVHVAGVGVVDRMQEPFAFGDQALTSNAPRSATITAISDLHTLTVERADFNEVMRGWLEKQNEMVADFLGKQPTFSSWSRTRLARLCARVQVRNLRAGEVLALQGRTCSHIAVVRRGAFHVRHSAEASTENRWPASNGTVVAALANAARCGLLRGSEEQRHVRIEEPEKGAGGGEKKEGEKKESEGGGAGGAGGGAGGEKTDTGGGGGDDDDGGAKKGPQSEARKLAAAAAASGLPLLPVPPYAQGSPARGGGGAPGASPTLRDRGWGAGLPGGTLAFSPRSPGSPAATARARASAAPSPLSPPARAAPAHAPYFLDTSRVLPTAVRHAVKTSTDTVGEAGVGAILNVQQCYRREPSPFTFVATETGTQVLLVTARYLALVGPEEEVRRVKLDAEDGAVEGDHGALSVDGPTAYAQNMFESLGIRLFPAARNRVVAGVMVDASLSARARKEKGGAGGRERGGGGGALSSAGGTRGDASSPGGPVVPGAARSAARAKVDAANARGDPAELLELLPFGATMVSKVLWSLVAKLVDEMDQHAEATLALSPLSPAVKGGASPRAGATPRAQEASAPQPQPAEEGDEQ
jgi:CRP-like cAMP-binding protein